MYELWTQADSPWQKVPQLHDKDWSTVMQGKREGSILPVPQAPNSFF